MTLSRLSPLVFKNSVDYLEYTKIRDKQDKMMGYATIIMLVCGIFFICIGGFFVIF